MSPLQGAGGHALVLAATAVVPVPQTPAVVAEVAVETARSLLLAEAPYRSVMTAQWQFTRACVCVWWGEGRSGVCSCTHAHVFKCIARDMNGSAYSHLG